MEQPEKPQVTELQRSDIYAGAVNVINKRLDDGETIDALEREYGLSSGAREEDGDGGGEEGRVGASAPPPVAPRSPAHAGGKQGLSFLPRPTPRSPHPSRRRRPHRRRALPLRQRLCEQRAGGGALYLAQGELTMGDGAGEADGDGGSSRSFRRASDDRDASLRP